jgi:hypothetical protein
VYNEIREAITLYYEIMAVFEAYDAEVEKHESLPPGKRKKTSPPEPLTLDEVFLKASP